MAPQVRITHRFLSPSTITSSAAAASPQGGKKFLAPFFRSLKGTQTGLHRGIVGQEGFTLISPVLLVLILIIVGIVLGVRYCQQTPPPETSSVATTPPPTETLSRTITDELKLSNIETGDIAVLVDGKNDTAEWNDEKFSVTAGTSLPLGANLTSPQGEVIAFAQGKRPTLQDSIDWKPAVITVGVSLENEATIPIDIWIVKGPFNPSNISLSAQPTIAAEAVRTTNQNIWIPENAGIFIDVSSSDHTCTMPENSGRICDRTAVTGARNGTGHNVSADFYSFDCQKAVTTTPTGEENLDNIQHKIGYTPGRLNVYYVEGVARDLIQRRDNIYDPTFGVHCQMEDWSVIALGSNTSPDILAHEIGHALSLYHVEDYPEFDKFNVMHGASDDRRYLTEGQTFRQALNNRSAINKIYRVRQNAPDRDCPDFRATDLSNPATASLHKMCPLVEKRLWADGQKNPN